jgi:multidrug efflux pump subunit AcrB
MISLVAIVLLSVVAIARMKIDIFPDMNLPSVMVIQPYGGMSPTQMEGYLTEFYEQHFFYINGVEEVLSRSIQSAALMEIKFRPETDMAEAMSEVVAQVERARAYMPPGTVNPFVLRFNVGNVPVGFLVFKSKRLPLGAMQDLVFARIRPIVATLKGVTTPPPFGANQRTIVVSVDNAKLNQYGLTPQAVADAIGRGNLITPCGIVRVHGREMISSTNATVEDIQDLGNLVIKQGAEYPNALYLRDIAKIEDSTDIDTGYGLADGRRTVYMAISKQASASTVSVVKAVREQIPYMESLMPADVKISFEFDQSKYVTESMNGLMFEGGLGAGLTGFMVLLFLQDLRSALIVVMNIPLALLSAVLALWATGQSINMMTLSGLALAVGILVDEATVMIENIHSQLDRRKPVIRAVYDASIEVAVPRLLAMLSVISVFMPSFFMTGIVRSLFVPLSLAVGFAMAASYFLSSSFVPILSCWLLKGHDMTEDGSPDDSSEGSQRPHAKPSLFSRLQDRYVSVLRFLMSARIPVLVGFVLVASLAGVVYPLLGKEIFPAGNPDSFQLRLKAPTGTRFETTEALTKKVLGIITETAGETNGRSNVITTVAFAGTQPPSYAINQVYMWTSGPQEAIALVSLDPDAHINTRDLQETLRKKLAEQLPDVTVGFEAGDIVNKIMNFGTPTPLQVDIGGHHYSELEAFARKLLVKVKQASYLRDVQFALPLEYPAIYIAVDRQRAGLMDTDVKQIGLSVAEGTYSSRFPLMVFWLDHKKGLAYQVQVQVPPPQMKSLADVGSLRVNEGSYQGPFLRDVASVHFGNEPGELDHRNMERTISITANLAGDDLSKGERLVRKAIAEAGEPPRGINVKVRGQVPTMHDTFVSLGLGVLFATVAIFIMLVAYFQSFRLSLCIISVMPAVVLGALLAIAITHSTLNVQSFMGTIMATGIGVANSILVVVFAEERRLSGIEAQTAAIDGAAHRLRPVLMTSLAMIAGMVPMALGLSEGGERTAPLGRAVIGGLLFSTNTVLLILPLIYSLVQRGAKQDTPNLLVTGEIDEVKTDSRITS